jgi:hypothetical protein
MAGEKNVKSSSVTCRAGTVYEKVIDAQNCKERLQERTSLPHAVTVEKSFFIWGRERFKVIENKKCQPLARYYSPFGWRRLENLNLANECAVALNHMPLARRTSEALREDVRIGKASCFSVDEVSLARGWGVFIVAPRVCGSSSDDD